MPKFNPNPSQVEAGFFQLLHANQDGYELKITGVKAFIDDVKVQADGSTKQSYGVSVALVVAEGEFAGKRVSSNKLYYHTEGGQGFAKPFLMSVYGFDQTPAAEQDFNTFAEPQDWGFDTDSGGVGDGFANLKGKRIRVFADVTKDKIDPTKEFQKYTKWTKI